MAKQLGAARSKRPAEDDLSTPEPKKQHSKLGRTFRNFLSPSSKDLPRDISPPDQIPSPSPSPDQSPLVASPPPPSAIELQQRTAKLVDEYFDSKHEKEAEAALKDPNRKLKWNINIKPTDDEYKSIRAEIHKKLEDSSVLDVVTEYFEEPQQLLLKPPHRDSIVLEIQKENGKRYTEALAPDGAFHGEKNNLTTKLAMLHFGLPIEAMTLNNVFNAGIKDEDDEEDTPEDLPSIQRIMFSEKPLEFLDLYGDRSYGFPMLRRPRQHVIGEPKPVPTPLPGKGHHDGGVHMRGGAGPRLTIYLYGPHGSRLTCPSKIEDDYATFQEQALKLLGLDENKDWEFVVDQYDNLESNKGSALKNFKRTFTVTKGNGQHVWDTWLKSRLCNVNSDWALVVNHVRPPGVSAPATFTLPTVDSVKATQPTKQATGDPTSEATKISRPIPTHPFQNPKTTATKAQSPKKGPKNKAELAKTTSPVKSTTAAPPPLKKPPVPEKGPDPPVPGDYYNWPLFAQYSDGTWDVTFVENHVEAFLREALQLLDLDEDEAHWTFYVDIYHSNEKTDPSKAYDTHTVTKATLNKTFDNIRPYLCDGAEKWKIAVRKARTRVEQATLVDERAVVCGYRGKVSTSINATSFLQTARQLLGLKQGPDWAFTVDVALGQSASIKVDASTYNKHFFDQNISKLLKPSSTTEGAVFLRFNDQPAPLSLEPDETWKHVIKLERESLSTAYWKIPADASPEYGINQCQKGFTDAMQLLFPASKAKAAKGHKFDPPAQNIRVGEFSIGWGGMEVTKELWADVQASGETLYDVKLVPSDGDDDDGATIRTGIRLVGSEHSGKANEGDFNRIYHAIVGLAATQLASMPTNVRVWKQARSREVEEELAIESEKSVIIALKPKAKAINALKDLFAKDPQGTNCVWFRPEWETFEVFEAEDGNGNADWHPAYGSKLSNFQEGVLGQLGYDGENSFAIVDTHDKQKFHIHVVDRDIFDGNNETDPEAEWRMHVYDWFHGSKLEVKLLDQVNPIAYNLDGTAWGIAAKAPNPHVYKPAQTTRPFDSRGPKFNKPRIIAPRAAPVKTEKYKDWSEKQNFENCRQIRSFLVDQPVVEPGHQPQAPIYGQSREIDHRITDALPSIFFERITPTDISRALDEKKHLQNQVLERETACPICDTNIAKYRTDEIRDHFNKHIQQIQSAGSCPICETEQWLLWIPDERKQHLSTHAGVADSEVARTFWDSLHCPVCDIQLDDLGNTKAILYHMAEHTPGVLQFCDRCGLHLKSCDQVEIDHHHQECILKPDRALTTETPIFCDTCGKNRSVRSHKEEIDHRRYCRLGRGSWCDVCGLEITELSETGVAKHRSHCKTPGGFDRKFCSRCGVNLAVMDALGLAYHKQTCFNHDAGPKDTNQKIQRELAFQRMTVELAEAKARSYAYKDSLDKRQRELTRKEKDCDVRETALQMREGQSGSGNTNNHVQNHLQRQLDTKEKEIASLRQDYKQLQNELDSTKQQTIGAGDIWNDHDPLDDAKNQTEIKKALQKELDVGRANLPRDSSSSSSKDSYNQALERVIKGTNAILKNVPPDKRAATIRKSIKDIFDSLQKDKEHETKDGEKEEGQEDSDSTAVKSISPLTKQPRKARNTRGASATPAPPTTATKRKRVASATPGAEDGPAPKTPKRAPGRPRRNAAIKEAEGEFDVEQQQEESEVPLTSPSKRVTRQEPK